MNSVTTDNPWTRRLRFYASGIGIGMLPVVFLWGGLCVESLILPYLPFAADWATAWVEAVLYGGALLHGLGVLAGLFCLAGGIRPVRRFRWIGSGILTVVIPSAYVALWALSRVNL